MLQENPTVFFSLCSYFDKYQKRAPQTFGVAFVPIFPCRCTTASH